MKELGLLCSFLLLFVGITEAKTKEIKINDVMELIKHVISDVSQMKNYFQKRDDELNRKVENLEVSTIKRVRSLEETIEEKIGNLEVKTIERVQKLSDRFTEQLRVRDIQMKEELDLRDLQLTETLKQIRGEFSQRLDEEHREIDKLKEENAAMKKEMKKCIGGKDLSKNISSLVKKQALIEEKQNKQGIVLQILENKIEDSIIVEQNISKKMKTMDTEVSHLKKTNEELQSGVELLNSAVSVLKDEIKDEVQMRKGAVATIQIVQADETRQLVVMKKSVADAHRVVNKVSESVEGLERSAKAVNASMISFENEMNEKLEKISQMNVTKLNTKIVKNGKEIRETNKKLNQVQMYIRYNATELGLTFKEILELAGEENFLEKKSMFVEKLLQQKKEFEKYEKEWNITYRDVIRLTNGSELKEGRQLTTIKKLLYLENVFVSTYKIKWGIEFKDVVRPASRNDFKDIPIKDGRKSIALLEKIDQLFDAFTPYKKLWKIHFKDIVDLTEDLNFEDAAKSPVFVKVKSWYVPGFKDVWGDSFDGFFHIMKKNPTKQSEFLGKIKSIADKERKKSFMKMLPGTFQYDGTTFSVHGYIKVFLGGRNGTVWMKGKSKYYTFPEGAAEALCYLGGYGETNDGWSNGKYRDGKGIDRSNMTCLISGLLCYGDEADLSLCTMDIDPTTSPPTTTTKTTPTPNTQPATTQPQPQPTTQHKLGKFILPGVLLQSWDHSEDLAIKCNF